MVIFYVLLPIIFVALYMSGLFWFMFYPYSDNPYYFIALNSVDYPSYCIIASIISIDLYILYILSFLLRCYHEKPFSKTKKNIFSVAIFSTWVYFFVFFYEQNYLLEQIFNWLSKNTESLLSVGTILLLIIIVAAAIFNACSVILGFDKLKYSKKKDFISCVALCAVYILICNYFMREGGAIYFVPFSEKYATTEDFPDDKRAVLKSFLKFAALNNYKRIDIIHSDKQISYEDLLTAVAVSPALLSPNMIYYPKFYVRYWTNEILYPLSDDLAQKEY